MVVWWLNAFRKDKMKTKNKINRSKKPPTSKPRYHLSGRIHQLKDKEKMRNPERERKDKRRERGLAEVRKKDKDRESDGKATAVA